MRLRKVSAFGLYVGSYLPLSLILLAQDLNLDAIPESFGQPMLWLGFGGCWPLQHPAWSLGALCATIIGLFSTLWTLRAIGTRNQVQVHEVKHIPSDFINYTIPYIVSFMDINFNSPTRMIGFGIFFLWIFWITYRSGQTLMNPVLVVFGWRLYEIKFSYLQSRDVFTARALTRVEIEPNVIYRSGNVQDVMIVREKG